MGKTLGRPRKPISEKKVMYSVKLTPTVINTIRKRAEMLGTTQAAYIGEALEALGAFSKARLTRLLEYRSVVINRIKETSEQIDGLDAVADMLESILMDARKSVGADLWEPIPANPFDDDAKTTEKAVT